MKRILYVTNLPAPYKVTFFNLLSKDVDLTVVYERKAASDRDENWNTEVERSYEEIYLNGKNVGTEASISFEIISIIKNNNYDVILMNGYSSPTAMLAITYMRLHHIKYGIVCDGMLPNKDSMAKKFLKTYLIGGASFYMSSGEITDLQLLKYGAKKEDIYWYPFSSISEREVAHAQYDKGFYKKKIGCTSDKLILYVGQLIHRKGIDILMNAYKKINNPATQLYIVGGGTDKTVDNITYIKFKTKEDIDDYYRAADLFVLPTREDIWGLVVNEALAFGVPVITTTNCGAGLEMLKNQYAGKLILPENVEQLADAMSEMINDSELKKYREKAIECASIYTIDNMARHTVSIIEKVSN